MNEYEIGLEDRKTKKRWAGENYGWQSPESFNKLYTEGKLNPAQQAIDRVTSAISSAVQQDPIVGPLLKFASGAAKMAYQAIPPQMQQGIQWGLQQSQTAAENIAAATGLPVSLTDPTVIAETALGAPGVVKGATKALKTVGKDLMTPPPSAMAPAMALTSSGGSIKLSESIDNLSPQVMPLTVTEPKLIAEGVTEGIAKTPKYKKALQERRMAVAEIEMRRQALIARGSKSAKKVDADLYGTASTLNIDPSADPIAYKKRKYLEADPTGTERFMHQHHLFPKGGSYAFIERMEQLINAGVADQDDLVNMFAYAEKLDATMGNRLSNMLNAPAEAHIGKGGIHSTLRTRGLEKPVTKLREIASQATNANEVMKLFSEYIATDVIPSKQIAKEITDTYLKSKKSFTKPEQSAMELFLEQLRKRGA